MVMARRSGTVVDQAGNIVTNAKIEVRREQPGQPLAALKSDRNGSVGMSNPFDAEADGSFAFHVIGGVYQIRAYVGPSGAPTFQAPIERYVGIGLGSETDSVAGGAPFAIVRVVATANVNTATGLEEGDTFDGATLVAGDFVLLTAQTAPEANGVYEVPASGAASRAAVFSTYDSMPGCYFSVMEGTAGADKLYRCTSNRGGTLETNAIVISVFSSGVSLGDTPTWTGLHTFGLGLTASAAVNINTSANNSFVVQQSTGTIIGSFRSTAASGPGAGGFFNIFSNDSAPLANGDRLGGLGMGGSFDTSGPSSNATPIALAGFATENWGSGTTGARLDFQMTPNGSGSRATAMSLHGSGGLGIGSATDPGTGGLKLAGGLFLGSFTVATLPTGVAAGNTAFATNCRVFNGVGTQEGAGAGTGGLVTYNGSAWKIAGTNITAVA